MLLCEVLPDVDDPVDTNTIRDEIDSRVVPVINAKYPQIKSNTDPNSNHQKAKRIRNLAKLKAKSNSPSDTEDPSGWRADPHQGSHVSTFLNR